MREISTLRVEAPFKLRAVDDYIVFLQSAAAPVIALLSRLAPEARDEAWRDMREHLSRFTTPEGWTGPNTLLVTAGRK